MPAINQQNSDDYSASEKATIRAILEGASVCEAAKLASLPDAIVEATFQRFRQAMKGAMMEAGRRFLTTTLGSSPVDVMDQILAELGSYDNDVIDNRQPDFVDRREEILNWKPPQPKIPTALFTTGQTLSAAPPQTLILTSGQSITAAFERHPILKTDDKLTEALYDLTGELNDVLEGMEPSTRRAFLDNAFDEWVAGLKIDDIEAKNTQQQQAEEDPLKGIFAPASSPIDILAKIKAELGIYRAAVINDFAPDFVDRREEIRTGKPREDRQKREHPATQAGKQPEEDLFTGLITPASSPVDMIDGIKQEPGWQAADDFDDTAPASLEKQATKQKPDSSSRVDPPTVT